MALKVLLVCLIFSVGVHCGCPFFGKAHGESLTKVVEDLLKQEVEATMETFQEDPLEAMNELLQQNYAITKKQLLKEDLTHTPLLVMVPMI